MTDEGAAARAYHDLSKLWPGDDAPRRVDAALVPKRYKRYVDLPSITLPPPSVLQPKASHLTLLELSALLHYSNGILRRRLIRGHDLEFRAASCTGAVYHIEAYVVCGDAGGLEAGVYHYDAREESLRPLRSGDFRAVLSAATCMPARECAIVLTSTFWRNAWRYHERAYRHAFWDSGTIIANLLALASARGLDPTLVTGFVDAGVNALLGVDGEKEAAVCVAWLGGEVEAAPPVDVTPIAPRAEPLSRVEIEYPAIGRMHEASSLNDPASVQAWRAGGEQVGVGTASDWSLAGAESVIERRGSARHFEAGRILALEFDNLIAAANSLVPVDVTTSALVYAVAHAVEDIEQGVYFCDRSTVSPSLIVPGDMRERVAHAALDQAPAGEAAVCFVWAVNLHDITDALGTRGYRAAQLEAAVQGGRVYLEATSLGLRATGLTFFDDDLAALLGLDPESTAVLFLVAAGR